MKSERQKKGWILWYFWLWLSDICRKLSENIWVDVLQSYWKEEELRRAQRTEHYGPLTLFTHLYKVTFPVFFKLFLCWTDSVWCWVNLQPFTGLRAWCQPSVWNHTTSAATVRRCFIGAPAGPWWNHLSLQRSRLRLFFHTWMPPLSCHSQPPWTPPPPTHTPPPPVLILVTADDEMYFNRDETDSDLQQLTLAETKRTNKYKQKSSLMTTVKGAGPKDLCLKQGFILTVL